MPLSQPLNAITGADLWLGAQAPLVTALLATLFAVLWQGAGTVLLAPVLRRSGLERGWSLLLAWFLWLPLTGSVAMALAMTEQISANRCRLLIACVFVAAAVVGWPRRKWFTSWLTRWAPNRFGGVALALIVLVTGGTLLFAAHPQRLYDQLNYHLVVAKRVLEFGHPYYKLFDPHLLIAGPVEYAFIWARALVPSDFFEIAAAQCWVFLASVVPCLAAGGLVARHFAKDNCGTCAAWATAALACAVPGLIPNAELVHIAKPGALLFAGTFIIWMAAVEQPRHMRALIVSLAMVLVACSPTFIHVALALGAVLLLWRPRGPLAIPAPLLLTAAFCLAMALGRSYVMTGTFFYPADARFLPSAFSDDTTLQYWLSVAFGSGQSFVERFNGAVMVPWRSPGLVAWALLALALGVFSWRKARTKLPPVAIALAAFIVVYVALWPFFYDGAIASRFVAGYVATLIAGAYLATAAATGRARSALVATGVVAGLACSSLDVMGRKINAWNHETLEAAFTAELPRVAAARLVNRWAGIDDTVVTDGPNKLFFSASVLSGGVSPQERQAWAELASDPRRAARTYGVQAVVIEEHGSREDRMPYIGPAAKVFDALTPYGTIKQVGEDLVLFSKCHFEAMPCPGLTSSVD